MRACTDIRDDGMVTLVDLLLDQHGVTSDPISYIFLRKLKSFEAYLPAGIIPSKYTIINKYVLKQQNNQFCLEK